jgi:dCMP deaminase
MSEYNETHLKQNGVCPICEQQGELRTDHYSNGKICGHLCIKCNLAIRIFFGKEMKAVQYLISKERSSWDEYFMHIALLTASRSKDRSTKVGAVIVRDRVILSTGYNGFPRGINDDIDERHERPEKYKWVCHSEENAILNAARVGVKVQGSDLFVTLFPCSGCAKSIIQSQIERVVVLNSDNPRWTDDFNLSKVMLDEGGVKIDYLSL